MTARADGRGFFLEQLFEHERRIIADIHESIRRKSKIDAHVEELFELLHCCISMNDLTNIDCMRGHLDRLQNEIKSFLEEKRAN